MMQQPTKTPEGWKVDFRPNGRNGKRYRKVLSSKGEATRYQALIISKHTAKKEWEPEKSDSRRLSDLTDTWYEIHGNELKDGKHRKAGLDNAIAAMKNPFLENFQASTFTTYRAKRVKEVSKKTCNLELTYFKAVFNECKRLGHYTKDNPLSDVRPYKLDEKELVYLELDEIDKLIKETQCSLNPHAELCALICLHTGARWSEAEKITISKIRNGRITYDKTKTSKLRIVPIAPEFEKRLKEHYKKKFKDRADKRLFENCYDALINAIDRAGISLPKGQKTHVLRHSFSSWFIMNGGNLLTLQKVLGHTSIVMTTRYAHLSPDYLNETIKLNPMWTKSGQKTKTKKKKEN